MIRKNKYRSYTVYCDECQEYLGTIEDNMADAWEEAGKIGWKAQLNSEGIRLHYCPECWRKEYEK